MPRTPVTTTIPDMDGVSHEYETIPWSFDEAVEIKLILAGLLGEPVGGMLAAFLGGGGDLDAEIDAGELGRAVGRLPQAIMDQGGPALIARILHDTVRYTETGGKRHGKRLRDSLARDEAYAGGNLLEAYRAIGWVLKVNYGPFLMGLSPILRGLWQRAQGLMQTATASAP